MSNVMAIAAGSAHGVALINDGTLVAWGDNSSGQTNIPAEQPTTVITTITITTTNGPMPSFQTNTHPPIVCKLIAAGGFHSMAALYSPLVQYPVDVTKDLLLIYNTNSIDSSNVCQYYLTHRPMVSNANVLGIGCTNSEIIEPSDYATNLAGPVQSWLATNPTKRPSYVILFQDIPSRLDTGAPSTPSVQYELNTSCATNWSPFVTSINMNGTDGTNDCIAYINKLASIGSNYSPGQLIISASAGGYGNTNWYFDDTECCYAADAPGMTAEQALIQAGVSSNSIFYTNVYPDCGSLTCHITTATNVAGYLCWGGHSSLGPSYATNESIQCFGQSTWYVMQTIESFNGQRNPCCGLGNFLSWFASNAFGGTNYSNTPVGAVCNVDEPYLLGNNNSALYFGEWAAERIFAYCGWNSFTIENQNYSHCLQVVGDPFTTK